jgi:salicylate hydroxylase
LQQRLGTPTRVVHRGDLQQVLLDAASHLPMRLRTSVTRVSTEGDEGAVELSDGQKLRASVVLGCDGLRSVARQVIANPPPGSRAGRVGAPSLTTLLTR